MIQITTGAAVWETALEHLGAGAERAGFFIADWLPLERHFMVRGWRPVDGALASEPGELHLSLPDETRSAVIQWATAESACLIEAHSHSQWSPAAFSLYDLRNLDEWVPHLRWRLRGRPYAAIVTSVVDFDALAWIDNPRKAEQVHGVVADSFFPATKATCSLQRRRNDGREPL
jgi:hypothetical protein